MVVFLCSYHHCLALEHAANLAQCFSLKCLFTWFLKGLCCAVVGTMTTLQRLSLADNKLTSLPKDVGNLTGLRVLNANNNQLISVPGMPALMRPSCTCLARSALCLGRSWHAILVTCRSRWLSLLDPLTRPAIERC